MNKVSLKIEIIPNNVKTLTLDACSSYADIIQNIICNFEDNSIKDPLLVLRKSKNDMVALQKGEKTLECLGAKEGMRLLVFKDNFPIKIKTFSSQSFKKVEINPNLSVRELTYEIAKKLNVDYYLGFSIYHIVQDKKIFLNENLPIFVQTLDYNKLHFGIKYYIKLEDDIEKSLEMSYSFTRDFVLTGDSIIQQEAYISLCAKIAMIEYDGNIEDCDSSIFLQYLPEYLQMDLNSEDDLFDEIKNIEKSEPNQMKKDFIISARSKLNFGTTAFEVKYIHNKIVSNIYLTIGCKGISFIDKLTFSVILMLKYDDFAFIETENDTIIFNDKYVIQTKEINQIKQLIEGYSYLLSTIKDISPNDLDLKNVYMHVQSSEAKKDDEVSVISIDLNEAMEQKTFNYMNDKKYLNSDQLNKISKKDIDAVKYLLFIVNGSLSCDFSFLSNFDCSELIKETVSYNKTICKAENALKSNVVLSRIEEEYGNELRSVGFVLYLIKLSDNNTLFDSVLKHFQTFTMELESKIELSMINKNIPSYLHLPKNVFESIIQTINTLKNSIKDENNKIENNFYLEQINKLKKLLNSILSICNKLSNKNDELSIIKYDNEFFCFKNTLIQVIPIIAFFDHIYYTKYSSILSIIYENINSLIMFFNCFPKFPTNIFDLSVYLNFVIINSYKLWKKIDDTKTREKAYFIGETLSNLQEKMPQWNASSIQGSIINDIDDILIQYQYDIEKFFKESNDIMNINIYMSILYARNCLKNLSNSHISENKSIYKKFKYHSFNPPEIILPRKLSKDDEVEFSVSDLNRLECKYDGTEKNTEDISAQYIDEINHINLTMHDLYLFLCKWKDKVSKCNPNSSLFKYVRASYESVLNILKINSERQELFQSPFLLLMKIRFHIKAIQSQTNKLIKFNDFIVDLQNNFFESFAITNDKKIIKFIKYIEDNNDGSISFISLKNLLTKLLKYSTLFKKNTEFSVIDILSEIKSTIGEMRNIYYFILNSQIDCESFQVHQLILERLIKLYEIYKDIEESSLNPELSKEIQKKIQKIFRSFEGLPSFLYNHHLTNIDGKLIISLLNIIWMLQHCRYEENKKSRNTILIKNAISKIKNLSSILSDINTDHEIFSHEIIMKLNTLSKEIYKNQDYIFYINICDEFLEIYKNRKMTQIKQPFKEMIFSIELIISNQCFKFYKCIFKTNNMIGVNINSSSFNSHSIKTISFSDSENEYDTKEENKIKEAKVKDDKEKLEPTENQKTRQGILLDPRLTKNRSPIGPHVTFNLSKDINAPIFSTSTTHFTDDVPVDLLPKSIVSVPWEYWNPRSFINSLKMPNFKLKEKNEKKISASKLYKKYLSHITKNTFKQLLSFDINKLDKSIKYSSKTEAINDALSIENNLHICLDKIISSENLSISEKIIFLINWSPTFNCLHSKLLSFNSLGIEIDNINQLYNKIKGIIEPIIRKLDEPIYFPLEILKYINILLETMIFTLKKNKRNLIAKQPILQESILNFIQYNEEVKKLIHSFVLTNDNIIIMFGYEYIESFFTNSLLSLKLTENIDNITNSKILSIIQSRICEKFYLLWKFIKKVIVHKKSSKSQITSALQSIKSSDFVSDKLLIVCNEINTFIHGNLMQYHEADLFSIKLFNFSQDIKESIDENNFKRKFELFSNICSLRFNLLNMNYPKPTFDDLLTKSINVLISKIKEIILYIKQNTETIKTKYIATISNSWIQFLEKIQKEFIHLQHIIFIAKNSPERLDQLNTYLRLISKEICILEDNPFPFPCTNDYYILVNELEKLIDISSEKQNIMYETPKFTFPKLEKYKNFDKFESIPYINYESIMKDFKSSSLNNVDKYTLKLLISHINLLSKETTNSIKTNYEIIKAICSSMKFVLHNLNSNNLKVIVKKQINYISGINIIQENFTNDLYFEITSKLKQIIMFLTELTFFNIKSIQNQDENEFEKLKQAYEPIKGLCKIEITEIESIKGQYKIFSSINLVVNKIMKHNNSFKLTEKEKENINSIKFESQEQPIKIFALISYSNQMITFYHGMATSNHFAYNYCLFAQMIQKYSDYIFFLEYDFLKRAIISIQDNYLSLRDCFDDPIEFCSRYAKIQDHFNQIVKDLTIIKPVVEAQTEKEQYHQLIILLKSIKKKIKPLKGISIFENISSYLTSLKKLSLLKLRVSMSVQDFGNFLLAIQLIIDSNEIDRFESMKKIYIYILSKFPCSKQIRQQINVYLQKSS